MKFKSINGNLAVTEDGDMVHVTYGVRNGKPFIRTEPVEINPEIKEIDKVEKKEEKSVRKFDPWEVFDPAFPDMNVFQWHWRWP